MDGDSFYDERYIRRYSGSDQRNDNGRTASSEDKPREKVDPSQMQPTIQYLDYKISPHRHTWYYTETKEDVDIPEQLNWWEAYALCLVRTFGRGQGYNVTLHINSPYLKKTLHKVIGDYPGTSFATKGVFIDAPYHALYHYLSEITAERATLANDECQEAKHLDVLIKFIGDTFTDTIADARNLQAESLISYPLLWTIFRPGIMLFSSRWGQPHMFELLEYRYGEKSFTMEGRYVDFDGNDFGTRKQLLDIPEFPGTRSILALPVIPAQFQPNRKALEDRLLERGKRFELLAGMQFQHYEGIALGEATHGGIHRFTHDGRVVVDTATFHRINTDLSWSVSKFGEERPSRIDTHQFYSVRELGEERSSRINTDRSWAARKLGEERSSQLIDNRDEAAKRDKPKQKLDDQQRRLCSSTVRGFSFAEKKWFDFQIDGLSDIEWDRNCFEKLVIPVKQKDMVKALVSTHIDSALGFDDIVKGKGLGLILVLHGPPGVGKTLTAETVAEHCQRPLYTVTSGDLGLDSEVLDDRLSSILDVVSTWKAVLLIDEADVFLERRSLHDLQRNGLVSTFLRLLEYYQGILFCTTNRVTCFDEAFKSRIHVPIRYGDLTAESRKQVWHNLLHGISDLDLSEEACESLSQVELNGRQIKNVIRTAKSLAIYHKEKLDAERLQQVIETQNESLLDTA